MTTRAPCLVLHRSPAPGATVASTSARSRGSTGFTTWSCAKIKKHESRGSGKPPSGVTPSHGSFNLSRRERRATSPPAPHLVLFQRLQDENVALPHGKQGRRGLHRPPEHGNTCHSSRGAAACTMYAWDRALTTIIIYDLCKRRAKDMQTISSCYVEVNGCCTNGQKIRQRHCKK